MKFRALRPLPLAAALAIATLASTASAQMSDSERKAAARAAFQEGVALQQQGKVAEALARFQAGEKLYDAPTISLRVAQCQVLLGKLVQGAETYETLVRKNLGSDATEAFVQAQKQAEAELPALRQRIPTLRVTVKPEAASLSNLHVVANDTDIPIELLGIARPVNPGVYSLHAVADGWTTQAPVELRIAERERKDLELLLVQQAGAGAAPTAAGVPPAYYPTVSSGNAGYTYPAPKAKSSSTGILLGARGGVLIPSGKDDTGGDLNDTVRAGGLFGLDGYLRVQNLLLGLSFDYAGLGRGNSSFTRAGTTYKADGGNTTYIGAAVGLVANVDKTSFLGNIGLGYRSLSMKGTTNAGGTSKVTMGSAELLIDAGLAIPAGALRIVPKFSLSAGNFPTSNVSTGGLRAADDDSGVYVMAAFTLGLYYHFDLGKKPAPAPAATPATTTPSPAAPAATPATTPATSS